MTAARRLHTRLRRVASTLGEESVSLDELARLHGPALQGSLLVLVSAPCALPIPGVGNVLGVTLILMALSIWRGRDFSELPSRVATLRLSAAWARRVLQMLALFHGLASRWSRQRLGRLTELRARSWLAWKVGLMGAVIFLPVPFGNVLPALAVSVLGLGVAHRDGAAVLLSALLALASVAYVIGLCAGAWLWMWTPLQAWWA
jgi:hypothetical protein